MPTIEDAVVTRVAERLRGPVPRPFHVPENRQLGPKYLAACRELLAGSPDPKMTPRVQDYDSLVSTWRSLGAPLTSDDFLQMAFAALNGEPFKDRLRTCVVRMIEEALRDPSSVSGAPGHTRVDAIVAEFSRVERLSRGNVKSLVAYVQNLNPPVAPLHDYALQLARLWDHALAPKTNAAGNLEPLLSWLPKAGEELTGALYGVLSYWDAPVLCGHHVTAFVAGVLGKCADLDRAPTPADMARADALAGLLSHVDSRFGTQIRQRCADVLVCEILARPDNFLLQTGWLHWASRLLPPDLPARDAVSHMGRYWVLKPEYHSEAVRITAMIVHSTTWANKQCRRALARELRRMFDGDTVNSAPPLPKEAAGNLEAVQSALRVLGEDT